MTTDPYETILAEIAAAKAALARATKLLERVRPQQTLLKKVTSGAQQNYEDFLAFYAAFPRHVGRGAAEKAYWRARQSTPADVILEGARRYAALRKGQDEQYTAHPATWLNGERWKDERASPPTAKPTKFDSSLEAASDALDAIERRRNGHPVSEAADASHGAGSGQGARGQGSFEVLPSEPRPVRSKDDH